MIYKKFWNNSSSQRLEGKRIVSSAEIHRWIPNQITLVSSAEIPANLVVLFLIGGLSTNRNPDSKLVG